MIDAALKENKKNGGEVIDRTEYLKARQSWSDYNDKLSQWARVFEADNILIAFFDIGNGHLTVVKMSFDEIGINFSDD
ncbi:MULTISPECIES: hypothetical protein [Falsihalocynthiibacter]|uniref:hypothetical protein n=1 Tax=Falsihalocynthiibacter TaxID=2854182 RepID=UPI0030011F0B